VKAIEAGLLTLGSSYSPTPSQRLVRSWLTLLAFVPDHSGASVRELHPLPSDSTSIAATANVLIQVSSGAPDVKYILPNQPVPEAFLAIWCATPLRTGRTGSWPCKSHGRRRRTSPSWPEALVVRHGVERSPLVVHPLRGLRADTSGSPRSAFPDPTQ
jgi:hypothetical protein